MDTRRYCVKKCFIYTCNILKVLREFILFFRKRKQEINFEQMLFFTACPSHNKERKGKQRRKGR